MVKSTGRIIRFGKGRGLTSRERVKMPAYQRADSGKQIETIAKGIRELGMPVGCGIVIRRKNSDAYWLADGRQRFGATGLVPGAVFEAVEYRCDTIEEECSVFEAANSTRKIEPSLIVGISNKPLAKWIRGNADLKPYITFGTQGESIKASSLCAGIWAVRTGIGNSSNGAPSSIHVLLDSGSAFLLEDRPRIEAFVRLVIEVREAGGLGSSAFLRALGSVARDRWEGGVTRVPRNVVVALAAVRVQDARLRLVFQLHSAIDGAWPRTMDQAWPKGKTA